MTSEGIAHGSRDMPGSTCSWNLTLGCETRVRRRVEAAVSFDLQVEVPIEARVAAHEHVSGVLETQSGHIAESVVHELSTIRVFQLNRLVSSLDGVVGELVVLADPGADGVRVVRTLVGVDVVPVRRILATTGTEKYILTQTFSIREPGRRHFRVSESQRLRLRGSERDRGRGKDKERNGA